MSLDGTVLAAAPYTVGLEDEGLRRPSTTTDHPETRKLAFLTCRRKWQGYVFSSLLLTLKSLCGAGERGDNLLGFRFIWLGRSEMCLGEERLLNDPQKMGPL